MFNNTDADDETSTEYEYVVFQDGDVVDTFDNSKEAEEVANSIRYDRPFASVAVEEQEVQEDEPEDDSGYGFLGSNEEETGRDHSDNRNVTKWSLGDHSSGGGPQETTFDEMLEDLDEEVDAGLVSALTEARGMVSSSHVSGFECPKCGLNHGHSDTKHDIRSAFGVTESFASQMDYVPYCHCGVNELAMLVEYLPYINTQVFGVQDRFQEVLDYDAHDLQVVRDYYDDGFSAAKAARRAGFPVSEADELAQQFGRYCELVSEIKEAASSAPVPESVRTGIAENREAIEETLA